MSSPSELSAKIRQFIVYLFHVGFFVIPFLWTPSTSELFEFPKMLSVYALAVIIGGLWVSRMILERKLIITKTIFDLPLILFLLSQILSTLFSIDVHTSLYGYYSRFHGGLFSTISYLIFYFAAVANFKKTQVKPLLATILSSAIFTSLYAYIEHFGHSPSCLMISGDFNVACWVQDVQTRVFGTFGQPNWLAAYIITLIFLHISTILVNRKGPHSQLIPTLIPYQKIILPGFMAIIMFLTLLFTKSRSGFLGFGLGLIVTFLLTYLHKSTRAVFVKAVYIVITLMFLFIIFGKGIVPQFDQALSGITATKTAAPVAPAPVAGPALEVGGTESSVIRRIVWKGAIDVFLRYPIFGSGTETFAYSYYNVRPVEHNLVSEWDFLYNKAHNEFLNFLATTGLFGFVSYLLIITSFMATSLIFILTHEDFKDNYLLIALMAGYLALAVSNFFGFSTVPVAMLFFLYPALFVILTGNHESEVAPIKASVTPSQGALLGLTWLVALFLVIRVIILYRADTLYALGDRYLSARDLPTGLKRLDQAAGLLPGEPVYTDKLALATAQAANALIQVGEATQAARFAETALELSDRTIQMNPVHINFLKNRARVFIYLSPLDPENYVAQAISALNNARALSPTDAKILYNLGLLYEQLGQKDKALEIYTKTLELKPNYEEVHMSIAAMVEADNPTKALEHYQYILDHISANNEVAKEKVASASAK